MTFSKLLIGSAIAFTMASVPLSAQAGPMAKVETHTQTHAHRIQVALLLDTSNSMDGLISQAKSQLWTLVNELSEGRRDGHAPQIELALYEYGNSNISAARGYVRQVLPLSTDLDAVSEKLFSLKTDGGEEYAGQVMTAALDELDWSDNDSAMKLMIIAGNEPFTQGSISYQSACSLAHEKGVKIDTIHCGSSRKGIEGKWKAGAECGHGIYMVIDQDEKYVHIDSPYDDDIIRLNRKLNDTYIGYGSSGRANMERQAVQDSNAASMGKGISLKRAKSKASSAYNNKSWDLVDAYEADNEALDKVKGEDLPKELQGKSGAELKQYIEAKQLERTATSKEIKALEAKRETYVAEKRKDLADTKTLDNVMVSAVRRQAKESGYKFDGR
ncbi:MAG: vWA domain-containing protein [Hellea sp.]